MSDDHVVAMPRRAQPIYGVDREAPPDVDALGGMSAEAVRRQCESAASSVKSMGEEINKRVTAIEGALTEADHDLKLLEEAAIAIREKGKLVTLQVEEMGNVSRDIRATVAELMKKIGAMT
jgi:predicted ribosome quality control (RQC) complex YloA/Tae2 family protein